MRGTELVATLPGRLADGLVGDPSFVLFDAPAEITPMTFWMAWHPRLDNDLAQQWMRDTIRAAMSTGD